MVLFRYRAKYKYRIAANLSIIRCCCGIADAQLFLDFCLSVLLSLIHCPPALRPPVFLNRMFSLPFSKLILVVREIFSSNFLASDFQVGWNSTVWRFVVWESHIKCDLSDVSTASLVIQKVGILHRIVGSVWRRQDRLFQLARFNRVYRLLRMSFFMLVFGVYTLSLSMCTLSYH